MFEVLGSPTTPQGNRGRGHSIRHISKKSKADRVRTVPLPIYQSLLLTTHSYTQETNRVLILRRKLLPAYTLFRGASNVLQFPLLWTAREERELEERELEDRAVRKAGESKVV